MLKRTEKKCTICCFVGQSIENKETQGKTDSLVSNDHTNGIELDDFDRLTDVKLSLFNSLKF